MSPSWSQLAPHFGACVVVVVTVVVLVVVVESAVVFTVGVAGRVVDGVKAILPFVVLPSSDSSCIVFFVDRPVKSMIVNAEFSAAAGSVVVAARRRSPLSPFPSELTNAERARRKMTSSAQPSSTCFGRSDSSFAFSDSKSVQLRLALCPNTALGPAFWTRTSGLVTVTWGGEHLRQGREPVLGSGIRRVEVPVSKCGKPVRSRISKIFPPALT